jgi:hypothetical protein
MGAFQQIGERLIKRGYAAIPIIPGTKRPGVLANGRWIGLDQWQIRYNGRVPSEIELARWAAGDTGVGVVGGAASHGMVAFDIDTEDAAIRAALDAILPATSVRKIGKRGETLFFYAPHLTQSSRWVIGDQTVCELIGPGRQTVIPPTVHPDTGRPYRWSGLKGLDAVKPNKLQLLPHDVVERVSGVLVQFGYEAEATTAVDNSVAWADDDTPHRQLNEAALADLQAWVPALPLFRRRKTRRGYEAVPIWRPSSKGRPDHERACNLKIAPEGIRDFGIGQGYTPLDLVMIVLGCDLERAFGFMGDRLGWSNPTIEVKAGPEPESDRQQPPEDTLLQYAEVPGVIGDIVDWVVSTARRPNRVLALGTAVTALGTLIGRRVASPTRSATHLYVVGVASTGNGKQHMLDTAIRLMKAAGAGDHIGPAKFFSLSAMIDLLAYKPVALCVQDEVGVFLKAITGRRASNHEAAVSQILRSLWGVSFATIPTPAWAARRMSLVSCPAISILGMSTPEEFYGALQGDSINNGFLNRFLVLQSNLRAADATPTSPSTDVPEGLRNMLRALYVWSGPESLLQINDPGIEYPPDALPWASEAAHTVYRDLVRGIERHMDDHPNMVPYMARCGEIAIRLATIRAAGRSGRGASVDASDMTWAAGLAWVAGQTTADAAIYQMPDTDRGAFADKLLGLIRRRGSVKVRDIQMHVRGRVGSREIKDIIRQLIEAGEVEFTEDGQYRVTTGDRVIE